jgi:hypothetical protein
MTWSTAVPLLSAGVIGLLWPENTALQSAAQTAAADVEALIAAYRTGLTHGAASDTPSTAAAGGDTSHSAAAAAAALLLGAGLALTACASQTPAQQAATQTSIASGLLCLADATGKVVQTAATNDPNTIKAVNSAIAAGDVLLTDTACQTALASGAAAIPQNATAAH